MLASFFFAISLLILELSDSCGGSSREMMSSSRSTILFSFLGLGPPVILGSFILKLSLLGLGGETGLFCEGVCHEDTAETIDAEGDTDLG